MKEYLNNNQGEGMKECNGPVKLDTKLLFESVSHNDRSDH